jgi:hypothetical protein
MRELAPVILASAFLAPIGLAAGHSVPIAPLSSQEGAQEIARGNVIKIDSANKTFTIKTDAEGAKETVISWNDATVFMREGKIVKREEVVVENANLTVTHKKGVAIKVEGNAKG